MIQPSMLRTATAFVDVRASEPEPDCDFIGSVGEEEPFRASGATESISISVDMMNEYNEILGTFKVPRSRLRYAFERRRLQFRLKYKRNCAARPCLELDRKIHAKE